jgi:hypothetical protein
MSDVVYIAVLVVFFALCTLYVQLCDRMIGPDELALADKDTEPGSDAEQPALVAASVGSTEVTS